MFESKQRLHAGSRAPRRKVYAHVKGSLVLSGTLVPSMDRLQYQAIGAGEIKVWPVRLKVSQ